MLQGPNVRFLEEEARKPRPDFSALRALLGQLQRDLDGVEAWGARLQTENESLQRSSSSALPGARSQPDAPEDPKALRGAGSAPNGSAQPCAWAALDDESPPFLRPSSKMQLRESAPGGSSSSKNAAAEFGATKVDGAERDMSDSFSERGFGEGVFIEDEDGMASQSPMASHATPRYSVSMSMEVRPPSLLQTPAGSSARSMVPATQEGESEELLGWFNRVDTDQEGKLSLQKVMQLVNHMQETKVSEASNNMQDSRTVSEDAVRDAVLVLNSLVLSSGLQKQNSVSSFRKEKSRRSSFKNQGGKMEDAVTFETFAELITWDGLSDSLDDNTVATALEIREAFIYESVEKMIFEYSHLKVAETTKQQVPMWQRMMDPVVGVMILINAVAMGLAADYASWDGWLVVEIYFTIFFLGEIVLKICLQGCKQYIFGHDWSWNWFDVVVVLFALVDLISTRLLTIEGGFNNMTILRVARLARLTKMMRLLRLLRLRIFKELALMVKGVIAGLRTLIWAIVLLVFVTYALGVLLRETVGEAGIKVNDQYGTVLFDSMPWSMFFVFRCFTSDCSLPDGTPLVARLYEELGPWFTVPYAIVIIFVIFGVFNLIAATFVENVMEAARQKRQLSSEEEASRVFSKLRQLILKFGGKKQVPLRQSMLGTGSRSDYISHCITGLHTQESKNLAEEIAEVHFQRGGQVTREIFENVLEDPQVQVLFDDLEVHVADRSEMFDVIDADGNGCIDVSELILGILKLRSGGADKSDMVAAILGIRSIQKTATTMLDHVIEIHQELYDLRDVHEKIRQSTVALRSTC